jgi:hypothetical protein
MEAVVATNSQPSHRVYVVVQREGAEDFWINVGAAFSHSDGKGFNVIVQALPVDGKLVLRVPQDDTGDDQRRDRSKSSQPKSGSRRR